MNLDISKMIGAPIPDLQLENHATQTPKATSPEEEFAQVKAAYDEMLTSIQSVHGSSFRIIVEILCDLGGCVYLMSVLPLPPTVKQIVIESAVASTSEMVDSISSVLGFDQDSNSEAILDWTEKLMAIRKSGGQRVASLMRGAK